MEFSVVARSCDEMPSRRALAWSTSSRTDLLSSFQSRLTSRAFGLARMTSATWKAMRSEEHTSELQSLMRISYAVFCLKKKKKNKTEAQQPMTCKQYS